MTYYAIVWTDTAKAQLRKLDRSIQRRIHAKVGMLADDPLRYLTRLVNSPYYRLRAGDWRIIVAVEHAIVTVVVLEVRHRRTAYH